MYPSNYHDNLNSRSVDPKTYLTYVARNNDLCRKLKIQYIWSVIKKKDGIFFTTSTSPSHDITKADHAVFYEKHNDPGAFDEVFATMQPSYSSFRNEWGGGRMVLIPFQNSLGEPYAFGASISTDELEKKLKKILKNEIATHLGLGLACGFLVIFLRRLWQRVELKNNAINHMRLEIFEDLAGIGAVSELGGWAYDPNEDYLFWSEKTYEIHELNSSHRVNVDEAINFYDYRDQSKIRFLFQKCLLEHKPFDDTFRIITAKGKTKIVRATGKVLLDEKLNTQLVYGSFLDITLQKQNETELKIYRNIIKQVPIPIFGLCKKGKVVYTNLRFKDIFGDYESEQFSSFIDDAKSREFEKYILNILKSEKNITENMTLVTKSGISLNYLAYFFRDDRQQEGKSSYFVMLIDTKDLTNLKLQNEMLTKELNHRIKNELQVLSSIVGLKISAQKEKAVALALSEVQSKIQALSIFQEVLGELGHYQKLDLSHYLSRLIKNYKMKYSRTIVRYECDERAIIIDGKRANYLGLLVNELLTNSFKHNDNKTSLSIFISLEKKDNIDVLITYSDSGQFYLDINLWETTKKTGIEIFNRLAETIGAEVGFKKDKRSESESNYCIEIKIKMEPSSVD